MSKLRLEELLRNAAYQNLKILVEPITGEPFYITEHDIDKSGFTIQRDSTDKDVLEIGNMTSADLKMVLLNKKNEKGIGKFEKVNFAGARLLNVEFDIKDPEACIETEREDLLECENNEAIGPENGGDTIVYRIKQGQFTVDNNPKRTLDVVTVTAFDDTVRLDRKFNSALITYPTSLRILVRHSLDFCDVNYDESDLAIFPNSSDILSEPKTSTGTEISCRQVVMWACQLVCTCAFSDELGKIKFKFYKKTLDDFVVSGSDRFVPGSDINEADTKITAHQFKDVDNFYPNEVLDDTYVIQTDGNLLFNCLSEKNKLSYANTVNDTISGFAYRGYAAETHSFPHLKPLDCIVYKKGDTSYPTIITNHTITLNGNSKLSAKAKSEVEQGFASLGTLTAGQQSIIDKTNKKVDKVYVDLDDKEKALLNLNDAITQALGLYETVETDVNGSKTYYKHDSPNLKESKLIYISNAGGTAWTDEGWPKEGVPDWKYGTDIAGNAIYNVLHANKLEADIITTGVLRSTNNASSFNLNEGTMNLGYVEEKTNADGSTSPFIKSLLSLKDKTLYLSGKSCTGTDTLKIYNFVLAGEDINDNGELEYKEGALIAISKGEKIKLLDELYNLTQAERYVINSKTILAIRKSCDFAISFGDITSSASAGWNPPRTEIWTNSGIDFKSDVNFSGKVTYKQ